jgi:PAS domain S-box-containing protein
LPDGTHVFVNSAYARYFGKERDELIGHIFRADTFPDDREKVRQFFATLTPEHPVDFIEHRIVMKNGEVRWQRWSDRAIFDKNGKLVEYQSVGRDITEQKQTEQALRESENRYRNVVEDQTEFVAGFCRMAPMSL